MRVKIISDGTPMGIKIIDLDTGEDLRDVVSVEAVLRPAEMPRVTLTLINVPLEIEADGLRRYELSNEKDDQDLHRH